MKKATSSFGASLIELIFAVALFSLVAAQCVQIFVAANTLSRESAHLSKAVIIIETVAESYSAGKTPREISEMLGAGLQDSAPVYEFFFDEDGNGTLNSADAVYIVRSAPSADAVVKAYDLSVSLADGEEIFAVTAAGKEARS